MADIGVMFKRPADAQRAIVRSPMVGLVLTASSAQAALGWTVPLPRNTIRRDIVDWALRSLLAVRVMFGPIEPRRHPRGPYYHPHREGFLEDAAMAREMHRL